MSYGLVYLIQPKELIGTNRYKLGCSNNETNSRVTQGYHSGSIIFRILRCVNPLELEKKLIALFNTCFCVVAGKEYFEGSIEIMELEFDRLFREHQVLYHYERSNKMLLD